MMSITYIDDTIPTLASDAVTSYDGICSALVFLIKPLI